MAIGSQGRILCPDTHTDALALGMLRKPTDRVLRLPGSPLMNQAAQDAPVVAFRHLAGKSFSIQFQGCQISLSPSIKIFKERRQCV